MNMHGAGERAKAAICSLLILSLEPGWLRYGDRRLLQPFSREIGEADRAADSSSLLVFRFPADGTNRKLRETMKTHTAIARSALIQLILLCLDPRQIKVRM